MRYALRKQDKIASVYSESYLKDHIIKSLNHYFSVTDILATDPRLNTLF